MNYCITFVPTKQKAMTNLSIYINECKAIKELYNLGLINDLEKQRQLMRAKVLYISQEKDSQ